MRLQLRTTPLAALAAVTALSFAPPASATTVTLNGTYSFVFFEDCQAEISTTTDSGTGDVSSLNTVNDGGLTGTIATAVFNSAKGTVTVKGWQDKGALLMVEGLSPKNEAMKDSALSKKFTFAATSDALTLTDTSKGGKVLDFNAVYGSVDGSGVAGSVAFVLTSMTPPSPPALNGCTVHGLAWLQTE
jgi:hypothetical protein